MTFLFQERATSKRKRLFSTLKVKEGFLAVSVAGKGLFQHADLYQLIEDVGKMQMFSRSDESGTSLQTYAQILTDLVGFGQILCQQPEGMGEKLCQQVMQATEGKARLRLLHHLTSGEQQPLFPISISFPVQFKNRSYGTFDVAPDPRHAAFPALGLPVAQLFAHLCGLLLYTMEVSALMEGQCRHLETQDPIPLTRREGQVLGLICRGYNQQTITTMLHITSATLATYRKRLSAKLGVHSERDIPLAAYQASLFSFLEEAAPD
jgi:DNA-binding CsgD family transcriptional regulator